MISPRLENFLTQHHVVFQHTAHRPTFTARELARAEHAPSSEVAKAVVFLADGAFGMAVLGANTHIDLNELRHAIGAKSLRLATENELLDLFPDTELGAMPPFGNLYGIPVYVDERLAEEPEIVFNAGTHRDVIHMKYEDFARLAEPLVITFARKC